MVRNAIHDPCFVLSSESVACPNALRPDSGLQLFLTKTLPVPQRGNARNVWMMELANGANCNVATGTAIPNYPFYCTGNRVCAEPQSQTADTRQYVECGQPLSAIAVTARRRFRVSVLYR
jgi:hypothetical protein